MNAHNEQQNIIAGALFDLMGYLTCREKKLRLSASDDAAPAVEALTEWAAKRGFDLDEARVTDWQAGFTAQPAAAQEAVMLYYVANVEQGGDFNYIPISMFDQPAIFTTLAKAEAFCEFANGAGSKHEVRRFAAPATAAPADLIERCKEILAWQGTGMLTGDSLRAFADSRWPNDDDSLRRAESETAAEAFRFVATLPAASTPAAPAAVDPVAAYERELAAGATHEHALHAICTPAAPGIDLTKFLPHTDAVIDKMQEVMAVHRFGVPTRVISDAFRTALLCQQEGLIDASPKSDSCATCNGHGMVGGLLPAGGGYESEPCPHCHGTAGHWEGCPAPDDASPKGGSDAPADGEVLVTVSGLTGSGKSAIAGEIEILCKALGLEVEWSDSEEEKRLTHSDWTEALDLYKPRVRIVEVNIPRKPAQASDAEVRP